MTYALGIDLGTTFTAAATWRDGHAEIAPLGSRAAAIPSVVLLREDETVLTGETAHRRGLSEPHRVSREFKRRLGDTTPILLGGVPYSAEALMARLLRWVIDDVCRREGGQPSAICISHPANWGPYKKDLLNQAVRLANVEREVALTTEPEAAAVFYAGQQRVEPGAVVAVYDLGGGTFDAAVLRKAATGFEILGQPEGIERLGGIDFDAAVFEHVRQALGGSVEELDEDDPAAIAAVARLREECGAAKEALSSDTDASIPVLLPNISTEIRLTRAELEAMVRPTLHSTIEALRRALRTAGVTPEQLHSVLLVGGSSRIPLVAQLVGAELGRPVAVDAHPKHAVALGAAWLAGNEPTTAAGETGSAEPRPIFSGSASAPPSRASARGSVGRPPGPTTRMSGAAPVRAAAGGYGDYSPPAPPGAGSGGRPRRRLIVIGAAALAFVVAAGTVARALSDVDADLTGGDTSTAAAPTGQPGEDTQAPPEETGNLPPTETEPQVPLDEQCTEEIMSNPRWVCLTSATLANGELVIQYNVEWAGSIPDTNGGFHLHLYGGDGTNPSDEIMGSHAGNERGTWKIEDQDPVVLDARQVAQVIGEWPKVCGRIAERNHALVPDIKGGYTTGNCVAIQR